MYEKIKIALNLYQCDLCPTRCDSVSKSNYIFFDDLKFAEEQEQNIIEKINNSKKYVAKKTQKESYPDIEIFDLEDNFKFYLEVKSQRRTFMTVEKNLPESKLKPSETVALNLTDLLRYIEIETIENKKVFIVWTLLNRPCIVNENEIKYFFQEVSQLKKIHSKFGSKRKFRRKSGYGDIVEGEHKGVVINYHFSLNELKEW